MGFIALKGVKVPAKIGVTEEERAIGRHCVVDVEIRYPLNNSSLSDRIEDTLNYEIVAKAILSQLKKEYKLMEAACRAIAVEILKLEPGIQELRITMQKLSPFIKGEIFSSVIQWNYPDDF